PLAGGASGYVQPSLGINFPAVRAGAARSGGNLPRTVIPLFAGETSVTFDSKRPQHRFQRFGDHQRPLIGPEDDAVWPDPVGYDLLLAFWIDVPYAAGRWIGEIDPSVAGDDEVVRVHVFGDHGHL